MTDVALKLISPASSYQDAKGIWHDREEISREIFARMKSVSRAEFFAGGQAGFRPELCFTVFHVEYQGEAVCEYDGTRYAIYRTYQVPGTDDLELYAKLEVGVHGQENPG